MKKFLSLVLALVMAMSLVTVSAGAKDFTDDSTITYGEAVAVVSEAGIVDGYTDGSFNPTTTLTRGAAAKIICNMILGPTTAAALSADTAPYSDVPTDHVFAGYISYCAQQGIISGYADGTFRPAGTLTGYAFMKMLLGALGYNAETEGYVGGNWSIAVAKQALNIDLDDGNDEFVGTKAVTREEACLYAFNTLKATMVDYSQKTEVTTGDATVTISGARFDKANGTKTDGYIKDDGLMQFAEKYFSKLVGEADVDDLGRPATTWKYDGDKIGTYADSADDTLVLNKNKTAAQVLYSDSDYFDFDEDDDFAAKLKVYVNGDKQAATKVSELSSVALKAGDQVEVFENDDHDIATIAVVRYSLARINDVDDNISSTYTKKGASVSISLEDLDETGIGATYYDVYSGDSSKVLAGFDADTYTEDTVLAIAMKADDKTIVDSHVAGVVDGKVTAYNSGVAAKVTVGEDDYPLHATIDMAGTATNMQGLTNLFNYDDSTYAVYTDVNGYVIGIEETESVKLEDVYYVTGITKGTNLYKGTYYAQAVALADGSVVEFKLKESDTATDTALGLTAKIAALEADQTGENFEAVKGLYTFEKDGSKYTAKKYTGDSTYTIYGLGGLSDKLDRDDTKLTITGSNGAKVYLKDDTNFVKVEKPGADIKVKTAVGGTSVANSGVEAIAITTKSGSSRIATYVILVSDVAFNNAGSDDVVFVAERSNKTVSYTDADGKTKTGYATELYFMNGTGDVETVTVVGRKDPGFYTWEINDDDVYELTSKDNTLGVDVTLATSGKYKDETGSLGYALGTNVGVDDYKLVGGVTLDSIYGNSLTISGAVAVNDVDFAEKVIIDDLRDKDARDADYYTSEITSVSQLKTALEKNDGNANVKAVVYLDDEEVIMVYVLSMAGPTGGNTSTVVGSAIEGTKTTDVTTAVELKQENAGAYTVSETDVTDIAGDIDENIFFVFRTAENNQVAVLRIYNADGERVYNEVATMATAGGHFFYVQVIGEIVGNAGSGALKTDPLTVGEYTWEVLVEGESAANGTFVIE